MPLPPFQIYQSFFPKKRINIAIKQRLLISGGGDVMSSTMEIQKGGCGKITTTGVPAYLLNEHYKVLDVDLNSQGNVSELLSQHPCNRENHGTISSIYQKI